MTNMSNADGQDTTSYFTDVVAWHIALGVPVGTSSDFELTPERLTLRRRLIEEEVSELLDALDGEPPEAVAKETADVVAVVLGLMAEMGIPFDAVWDEVHRSNMAKFGPDGKPVKREDGKVLKPPGWTAPDIAAVLRNAVPGCDPTKESRLSPVPHSYNSIGQEDGSLSDGGSYDILRCENCGRVAYSPIAD